MALIRQLAKNNSHLIVPTLRRGNVICDAPASRNAGALPDEFPRWSMGTRLILGGDIFCVLPKVCFSWSNRISYASKYEPINLFAPFYPKFKESAFEPSLASFT